MQYYDEADAGIDGYRPIKTWRLLKFAALLLATATLSYAGFVGFVVVKVTAENMATLKDYRDERLKKLSELRALGINPYPAKSYRTHKLIEVSEAPRSS